MNNFLKQLQEKYDLSEQDLDSLANLLFERKAEISEAMTIHDHVDGDPQPVMLPYLNFLQKEVLGIGASSIVHRVYDDILSRFMAMKIVKEETMTSSLSLNRFVQEAQLTARLQHPGILPVHHLAQQEDGRMFFTMPEVQGKTFLEIIRTFHKTEHESNVRPLIEILRKVCDAVGYAHSQGVIHRDIKPSNIMVGSYGEVWVLDWGLGLEYKKRQPRSVVGTPMYMSPEQARGEDLYPTTDVYSIGCLLYYVMTGQTPYKEHGSSEVIRTIIEKSPVSVRKSIKSYINVDEELIQICEKSMHRSAEARYEDANALRKIIGDWLDGTLKRSKGLELVEEAERLISEGKKMRRHALFLQEKAVRMLSSLPAWERDTAKLEAWKIEDEAQATSQEVNLIFLKAEQLLHAALTYVPTLQEAHTLLCQWYRENHQDAERLSDQSAIEKSETKLRAHVDSLPYEHSQAQLHRSYLKGMGALSLVTDPPGAEVLLHRYEVVNRRKKADFVCVLGKTPIKNYPLPMGSYLVIFRKPGHHEVRYPVHIGRQEHWDGMPPDSDSFAPISLPPKGSLSENESYVPAGWYWSGGDQNALYSLPLRRIWVPSFIIQKFPVTNSDYIGFLNHLVTSGKEHFAFQHVPSENTGTLHAKGEMVYGLSRHGWFYVKKDSTGLLWEEDWPVFKVNFFDAQAYAAYFSERSKKKWHIPNEVQWEKAARGVDKRFFPWGDFMDPAWTCMRLSHSDYQKPQTVHNLAVDISPFGIYGMGGNAREMTSTPFVITGPTIKNGLLVQEEKTEEHQFYTVRGGSWYDNSQLIRSCSRSSEKFVKGSPLLSFRLLRLPDW